MKTILDGTLIWFVEYVQIHKENTCAIFECQILFSSTAEIDE